MSWIRVNRNKPCPICGQTDWCSVAEDGSVAFCMREPSEKECKSGGWVHVLNPDLVQRIKNVFKRQPKKRPRSPEYWHIYIKACRSLTTKSMMSEIVEDTGLNITTLECMLVAYDKVQNAQVAPMWDGVGRMVGMRLRSGKDKWSITGSLNGLFWPINVNRHSDETLVICEGWTDTGAAIELGFEAIGRFNCSGGTEYIKSFLKCSRRKVIIMADNDKPKKRTDGSTWRPGIEGAVRLADAIAPVTASVKVVQPPVKDLREWYRQGCTIKDVEALI